MTAPPVLTNATVNVTGMYTFFQYVQEVSNDWFMIMILFALFIILFVTFRATSMTSSKPFAGASFFVMVLSILFRVMDFISNKWMYFFITLTAGSAVWLHLENSQR